MHIHIKPRKGFIPKYSPFQQRGTTMTVQTTLRVSGRSSSKLMPIRDTAKTRGEDRKLWHCPDTTFGHWQRHTMSWGAAVPPKEKLPDSSWSTGAAAAPQSALFSPKLQHKPFKRYLTLKSWNFRVSDHILKSWQSRWKRNQIWKRLSTPGWASTECSPCWWPRGVCLVWTLQAAGTLLCFSPMFLELSWTVLDWRGDPPFCVVSSQPAQKTLIPRESPWRAWAEAGALHPSASTWILGSLGKKNHSPLHFLTGAAGKWQRICTYGQPVSNLGTLLNAVHKKRAF